MNIIFIIVVFVFGLLLFGLPVWNLARLVKEQHLLWLITPPVLVLVLFSTRGIFEGNSNPFWYKIFEDASFYIVIFLLMLFGVSLVFMIFGSLLKIRNRTIFLMIIISTLLYFTAARIHGEKLIVKEISIPASQITRDYQFVHISDLQRSSNRIQDIQKIVDGIKSSNSEFVVITGDLIETYFVSSAELEPFNQLTIPVFLITGNHEYYLEDGKIEEAILGTNILLIDGMKVGFDELDIIGVNELETTKDTINKLGGVDEDRYTVALKHQPLKSEIQAAQEAGIDLFLAGHTHAGQVWPFGLLVKTMYPYVSGLYDLGDMYVHINPGTGTLGPKMRLGTTNEVSVITLSQ